jgi:hypothetical protein
MGVIFIAAISILGYIFGPRAVTWADTQLKKPNDSKLSKDTKSNTFMLDSECGASLSDPKRLYSGYSKEGQLAGFTGRVNAWLTVSCDKYRTDYDDKNNKIIWIKMTERLHVNCSRDRFWIEYAAFYNMQGDLVGEFSDGDEGEQLERSMEGNAFTPNDPFYKKVREFCHP